MSTAARLKNIGKPKPLNCYQSRPIKDFVLIRQRQDLDPNSGLIISDILTASTTMPDNMRVVEVLGVGPEVKYLKKGDIAVIDKGGIIREFNTAGTDEFVVRSEDFRVLIDSNAKLHPLPDFVLTKEAPERMKAALMGDPSYHVPPSVLTSGFVSRWTNIGRVHQDAERRLGLDKVPNWRRKLGMTIKPTQDIPAFHATFEEVVELGANCIGKGLEVGDLTMVTHEMAIKFRVHNVTYRISDMGTSCHCVVDDKAIVEEAQKRRQSPLIQLV